MAPGRRPTAATAKDLEWLSRTMIAASAQVLVDDHVVPRYEGPTSTCAM